MAHPPFPKSTQTRKIIDTQENVSLITEKRDKITSLINTRQLPMTNSAGLPALIPLGGVLATDVDISALAEAPPEGQ